MTQVKRETNVAIKTRFHEVQRQREDAVRFIAEHLIQNEVQCTDPPYPSSIRYRLALILTEKKFGWPDHATALAYLREEFAWDDDMEAA